MGWQHGAGCLIACACYLLSLMTVSSRVAVFVVIMQEIHVGYQYFGSCLELSILVCAKFSR